MSAKLKYYGIKVGEWTPARDCELNARAMRFRVTEFNDAYGTDDNHKYYIVSGMAGYKLTRNLKEIRKQIEHDERLAKGRLKVFSERKRRLERFEKLKAHGGKKTYER